eukprot:671669_1
MSEYDSKFLEYDSQIICVRIRIENAYTNVYNIYVIYNYTRKYHVHLLCLSCHSLRVHFFDLIVHILFLYTGIIQNPLPVKHLLEFIILRGRSEHKQSQTN